MLKFSLHLSLCIVVSCAFAREMRFNTNLNYDPQAKLRPYATINEYLKANASTLDAETNLQVASKWLNEMKSRNSLSIGEFLVLFELKRFVALQRVQRASAEECNLDDFGLLNYNYDIVKKAHADDPLKWEKIFNIVNEIAVGYAEKCTQYFLSQYDKTKAKDHNRLNRIFNNFRHVSKSLWPTADLSYNISTDIKTIKDFFTGDDLRQAILREIRHTKAYNHDLWRPHGLLNKKKLDVLTAEEIPTDYLIEPCKAIIDQEVRVFEPALYLFRISNPNKIIHFSGHYDHMYNDLLIEYKYCQAIIAESDYVIREIVNSLRKHGPPPIAKHNAKSSARIVH